MGGGVHQGDAYNLRQDRFRLMQFHQADTFAVRFFPFKFYFQIDHFIALLVQNQAGTILTFPNDNNKIWIKNILKNTNKKHNNNYYLYGF